MAFTEKQILFEARVCVWEWILFFFESPVMHFWTIFILDNNIAALMCVSVSNCVDRGKKSYKLRRDFVMQGK